MDQTAAHVDLASVSGCVVDGAVFGIDIRAPDGSPGVCRLRRAVAGQFGGPAVQTFHAFRRRRGLGLSGPLHTPARRPEGDERGECRGDD